MIGSTAIRLQRPLRHGVRLLVILSILALWTLPGNAGSRALLAVAEADVIRFIDAAADVATWQAHWTATLGKPKPSDNHLLIDLIDAGAEGAALDDVLQGTDIASLETYIALERQLADIYHALYADTSALAVMATDIELAVKGQTVSPLERSRMIKQERMLIEYENRASVAPETIDIVSRHALALARALGDIK